MPAPSLNEAFSSADVLGSTRDETTGAILLQIGDVRGQTTESDGVELLQQAGFVSIPSKADPGKSGAQAFVVKGGSRDKCIAMRDLRGLDLAGSLKEGETCMYGAGADGTSQGRILAKDGGAVALLTTSDNTPNGKVVALQVSPTALTFTAPWGSLVFDATGLHIKTAAGPRIDMGAVVIPGIPPSVSGILTGYCRITAPVVKIAAGTCYIGQGTQYCQAVVSPSSMPLASPPGTPYNIAAASAAAPGQTATLCVAVG